MRIEPQLVKSGWPFPGSTKHIFQGAIMSNGITFDIGIDFGQSTDEDMERMAYLEEAHVESSQFGVGRSAEFGLNERD